MKITIDFETRSLADIKEVGAWMYSRHPSTEILCLSWRCGSEHGLWHRAHPGVKESPAKILNQLFKLMRHESNHVEAHNAFFERAIWLNVCVVRMHWPAVPEKLWRCSAAKASACSIPRGLGDAGRALHLVTTKDEEGKRVMMRLTKPAKPTKKEPDRVWHEKPEDLEALWKYCETDTASEDALSASLPDLIPREQKIWEMDQRMNLRGVALDIVGVRKAIALAESHVERLNEELTQISGVPRASLRAQVLRWLVARGHALEGTAATILDAFLADPGLTDEPARRAVEIVRSIGRSSVKKYNAMTAMADVDQRARDLLMYHGAGTGRWAGKMIQPHNFPRGTIKNMEQVWEDIHSEDLELIDMLYGDPMTLLSHALRGAIWAPPGRELFVADYASIEARVCFWLSDERKGLEVFRRGEDIYCDMAAGIYGRKITKADAVERQFGKQAILGLGFGMGFVKFLITCRLYGISFTREQVMSIVGHGQANALARWIRTDGWIFVRSMIPNASDKDILELVLMKFTVDKYRQRYRAVTKAWEDLNAAAISAVRNPKETFRAARCTWKMYDRKFLTCRLPSGRSLYYPYPELHDDHRGPRLTYMGVDANNHQWTRQSTYGGKLMENVTQAVARDIMAEAMLRCDQSGVYDMVLSVHDEIVAEADSGMGILEEFNDIVQQAPEWASDCPITAEAWTGRRYRK